MEFPRSPRLATEEGLRRLEEEEEGDNSSNVVPQELDWLQTYLNPLPDGYMKAKFTLSAYLACWLILKLCKKAYEQRSRSSKEKRSENCQLYLQLQSKHDTATSFVDVVNAFKKVDPQEAINCLMRAIEIYIDMGCFIIAANTTSPLLRSTELMDIKKVIAHYEQLADYYKGEEFNSSANKCLLKMVGYTTQLEQYQKAMVLKML